MIDTKVMPNNKAIEKRILTALMIYTDITHEIIHKLPTEAF